MLKHCSNTFQAHAGVYAGLGQRVQHPIGAAVKLHEHQVPHFNVSVAIFFRASGWTTPHFGAMVVENFGARAARAGVGHLPKIVGSVTCALVVADANNTLGGHTHLLVPDVVGLVIFLIHRDVQAFRRQLVNRGQQFPGVLNGVFLEVIAKAEVAQHFKKGVMAGRVTHVFKVVVLAARAN